MKASQNSSSAHTGPWSYEIDSDSITIINGRIYMTDELDTVPIENLGQPLGLKKDAFVYLTIPIEDGIPKTAKLQVGEILPDYRTYPVDARRSIKTQMTLSVVVLEMTCPPRGRGDLFYPHVGYGIFKSLNSDMMLYAGCDGLILVPGPYSTSNTS